MFDLSVMEIIIFVLAVLCYAVAGVVSAVQVVGEGQKYRSLLLVLVVVAILLEGGVLGLRAVEIKAFPLTGLFESMIALTMVFGVVCVIFSITISQVWFSSIMVWVILAVILMAGIVAEPASEPALVAATPWAIAHGAAMVLGAASVMFATANAVLYLIGSYKLKHKRVMKVLGRMPSIETLGQMNLSGIKVGFVLISVGLVVGIGLVFMLKTGLVHWLTDWKVMSIFALWLLMAVMLVLNRMSLLRDRTRAYITILAFALVLFAIIGVAVIGVTQHEFSFYGDAPVLIVRYG